MVAESRGGSWDTQLTDAHVAGVARRDPDALGQVYEALADPLFRYVRGLCGDPQLAEDMVEDTFLELVEHAPQLTGGVGGLRAWLYRAARNNLIDAKRKIARHGDVALDETLAGQRPGHEPGPEDLAMQRDGERTLLQAMQDLSDEQREVLLLRFASGLSGPEVAEATGRSHGAVKSLQHRALAAMARILKTDTNVHEVP